MAPSQRSFRLIVFLAGAFLLCTVIAGLITQRQRTETSQWVDHTTEVKLAIDDGGLKLLEAELEQARGRSSLEVLRALRADARALRRLTSDNPRQQTRLDRVDAELETAIALSTRDWKSEPLRALLDDLRAEEDSLMTRRKIAQIAARTASTATLEVSGLATLLLVIASLVTLTRQHGALARQSVLFGTILESIGDGVLAANTEGRMLVTNASARGMLGKIVESPLVVPDGEPRLRAVPATGEDLPATRALSRAVRGEATDGVTFLVERIGEVEGIWLSASGRPLRDAQGQLFGGVAVYHDVSELKRHAEALKSLSLTDELTGLHNRRGFVLLAEQHARLASRTKAAFALIFADMNGLKKINDTLGHEAGDRALRDIARVLRATLRETDILARLGGDEFVALLANTDSQAVEAVSRRVREALEQENHGDQPSYRLSMSMGVAVFDPGAPRSVEDLLSEADRRMYENKAERHQKSAPILRIVGRS